MDVWSLTDQFWANKWFKLGMVVLLFSHVLVCLIIGYWLLKR